MADIFRELVVEGNTKILFLSMDGLGGLPRPETGKSEMETAKIPNLHALATRAITGMIQHVAPGIIPGSGPGHLGLFGYDPLRYQVGRGVLEALGIDFDLKPGDVAARGNFCTVDGQGLITDRRAGRITTEKSAHICERLRAITLPGVQLFVEPVKEHRFVLVLRGEGLSRALSETDPQAVGKTPLPVEPLQPEAERTAGLVNQFVAQARRTLADAHPANMVLLRGFDGLPDLPPFPQRFGLRAAAVATYPMYRGLAKLVGMEAIKTGKTFSEGVATVREHWGGYDFFFLHYKETDRAGEDGDFDGKVAALEEVDGSIPSLLELKPDVFIVTGDHSTPSVLKGHSWHPVPFLLVSPYCRPDHVTAFTERACAQGALGTFPAHQLMALAMANALRLTKFGA